MIALWVDAAFVGFVIRIGVGLGLPAGGWGGFVAMMALWLACVAAQP